MYLKEKEEEVSTGLVLDATFCCVYSNSSVNKWRKPSANAHDHVRKEKQNPPFALMVRRVGCPEQGSQIPEPEKGQQQELPGGLPRPQLRGTHHVRGSAPASPSPTAAPRGTHRQGPLSGRKTARESVRN